MAAIATSSAESALSRNFIHCIKTCDNSEAPALDLNCDHLSQVGCIGRCRMIHRIQRVTEPAASVDFKINSVARQRLSDGDTILNLPMASQRSSVTHGRNKRPRCRGYFRTGTAFAAAVVKWRHSSAPKKRRGWATDVLSGFFYVNDPLPGNINNPARPTLHP